MERLILTFRKSAFIMIDNMLLPPMVIIADPDPMFNSALRVEFTRLNFVVLLAASGKEIEDYASQADAHLIIIDLKLHLGGYDACARVRRMHGYSNRPIVLTTGQKTSAIEAAANKASATALLLKPYSVVDLFKAIEPSLPPDDLLLVHRAQARGMSAPKIWVRSPTLTWGASSNSKLAQNGQLLPIFRGKR